MSFLNRLSRRLAAPLLAGGLALLAGASAHARDALALPVVEPVAACADLAHADLGNAADAPVTIAAATTVDTPKGAFCKVEGTIAPSIGFEVDLPVAHWTQRFLMGGCGGMCGMTRVGITNAGRCGPALDGQFVVAGDDMGHKGSMGGDDEAAFGSDPQKRIDFAYRGNHQTARVAKALIRAFYGRAPRFSYFMGCSDGGREALVEAQRYPEDFDGVSAGAPATLFVVQNSFYHAWSVMANQRADGSNILLAARTGILHDAVLAHCDTLSGVRDGVLQDPRACRVDPAWAQCKAGETDTQHCLSAEEVAVARRLYDGPRDKDGRGLAIGGPEAGSEAQWMLPASADGQSMSASIASRALQSLILPTPEAAAGDLRHFAFDDRSFERVSAMAPLYDGTNTDLRPFQRRGGKLILWHGWSDTSVAPAISIAYYQGVQAVSGAKATDTFLRLFLLPGVGHCGGGDGDAQVDLLTPLMAWTELQRAPARLLTGKTAGGGMGPGGPGGPGPKPGGEGGPPPAGGRLHADPFPSSPVATPDAPTLATRPVYPYPAIARYVGHGDVNDAANYRPAASPVKRPLVFDSLAATLVGPGNQKTWRAEGGALVAN